MADTLPRPAVMIIDSQCHLHDPVFGDLGEMLARAIGHGVRRIIAVGCDPATNAKTLEMVSDHPDVIWPCLGYHPEWTHLDDAVLREVERQVANHRPRIVGLGEIGLPWYCLEATPDTASLMVRSRERLGRLLELAARYSLPVVLHAPHGAAADALGLLRRHQIERAIFHWHKAPADLTRQIVDAGYLVSVTPELLYRERDRELVEAVPLEALLVETDSPWPYGGEFTGIPTEPWMAARVVQEVAKIKCLPSEAVISQLFENFTRLFHPPMA